MNFNQKRSLFRKPQADDFDGVKLVKAKPISEKIARRLNADGLNFRGKDFQTASTSSQKEFYGLQEVKGQSKPSGSEEFDREISPSSGSEKSDDEEPEPEPLTEEEKNKLNAKILKAQLKGDKDKVKKLQAELKSGVSSKSSKISRKEGGSLKKKEKQDHEDNNDNEREILLMKTDYRTGMTVPLAQAPSTSASMKDRFEENKSLSEMVAEERMTTADDHLEMFTELAGKGAASQKIASDWTIDDVMSSRKRKVKQKGRDEEKKRAKAIRDQKRLDETLDSCHWCLDGNKFRKECLIASGLKTYLCIPRTQPLTDGHCLIVPMGHVSSALQTDEDVYQEMMVWRKGLVRMFAADDRDCIFVETAKNVDHQPHAAVHCIPVDQEVGSDAPIYFKKAILECESEWSDNRKLVDLRQKGLRSSIPKGFSYFAVDFGLDPGYGHIIEQEDQFPKHFATEIIGGMMDCDRNLWRKPKKLEKYELKEKAKALKKLWAPFDWTERVKKAVDGDDQGDGDD